MPSEIFLMDPPPLQSVRTNYKETDWLIHHLKSRKTAGSDAMQNVVLQTYFIVPQIHSDSLERLRKY